LEILPGLAPGVYVHVHDIFTPFDYPDQWIRHQVRFWNEQYLLEALLTGSTDYTVVGALHFLSRRFPEMIADKFPIFASTIGQAVPGSFWIKKRP
jgi:hypothetical protein